MDRYFDNISKNRNILMGIAMLWVILHHCNCNTHYKIPLALQFPFLNLGYLGVDIFVLLSGFGIYCSLSKNENVLQFLYRRIVRLIPVVPIFIIYIVFNKMTSVHKILGCLLFQNYWLGNHFLGFLSMILLFYFISPVLKNIIDQNLLTIKHRTIFILILILISLCYRGDYYLYVLVRLPIYVLGMYIGYDFYHKKNSNIPWYYFMVGAIIGFVTLVIVFLKYCDVRHYYGLVYYPAIIFIPSLLYFFNLIIDFFNKRKIINLLIKFLSILGTYSLTIYAVDFFITTQLQLPFFVLHFFLSIIVGCIYGLLWEITIPKFLNKFTGGDR